MKNSTPPLHISGKEVVHPVTKTLVHYYWKSDCGTHIFQQSAANVEAARTKMHRHFEAQNILPRISN